MLAPTGEFRSKIKIPLKKKNQILQIFGIILLILLEIIPNSRKIMVFFMEFYFCYETPGYIYRDWKRKSAKKENKKKTNISFYKRVSYQK